MVNNAKRNRTSGAGRGARFPGRDLGRLCRACALLVPGLVVLGLVVPGLVVPGSASAAEVTRADLTAAVETWVGQVTADGRPDAVVESLEPYPATGRPAAYIARLRGGGYCITGADDRLLPVTLYRAQGSPDPSDPNIKMILRDITARLERIEAASAGTGLEPWSGLLRERLRDWRALASRQLPPSSEAPKERTAPALLTLPVTSAWTQGSPYNDDCPALPPGSDDHVVVGCVATATAQIMRYWQWPPTGYGTGSIDYAWRHSSAWFSEPLSYDPGLPEFFAGRLRWSGGYLQMTGYWDNSIYWKAYGLSDEFYYRQALANLWGHMSATVTTYSANFAGTTYSWDLMQDQSGDPPDPGGQEAAELSAHVAIAETMDFGLWGSGSDHLKAEHALQVHFSYDYDVYDTARDEAKMLSEIQWLRPLQLAGAQDDPPAGHSWVVCGYNTTPSPDQFLMNMGWGGGSVDWYSVDQIFPLNQYNLLQISPAPLVRYVGATSAGDGGPALPFRDIVEAASVAPNGATLIFKAGSDNTFTAASAVIDRPMTLKGVGVTIHKL